MTMLRTLLALLAATLSVPALAAARAQMITPLNTSILGGEARVYSVRFSHANGQPAVGEPVVFANDACGFFENGQFAIAKVTNASGIASATFTARGLGIGCWITASAGASVRFNVFTYSADQVSIEAESLPADVRPGEDFTFRAGAYQGAYPIYEADVSARVIPGTISAQLSPSEGNMGTSGRKVGFEVTPQDRLGTYEIEVQHRTRVQRFPFHQTAQDMWWGGLLENGWGVSIVQHRDAIFAVIYAYDAAGKPTWYVLPAGTWNEGKTAFSGALYRPTGTPYASYDASKLVVNDPVGTATLTFPTASNASLDYTIDGATGRKSLTRQRFGPEDSIPLAGLGDMWWGGMQQNGWGIAVLQQYRALFSVWFTYDAQGAATWFVMPSGRWSSSTSWEGRLYRTTGSPWLGQPYDARLLAPVDVGTFKFTFAGESATFDYVIDGAAGTMPLVKQEF